MHGMNRETGAKLDGWDHVLQSLLVIFTTEIGQRVKREWLFSIIPRLLGENMTPDNVLRFFVSVAVAIELYEPRFRLIKVDIENGNRQGTLGIRLHGEYFPNALAGDYTTKIRRSLILMAQDSGFVVSPFNASQT